MMSTPHTYQESTIQYNLPYPKNNRVDLNLPLPNICKLFIVILKAMFAKCCMHSIIRNRVIRNIIRPFKLEPRQV